MLTSTNHLYVLMAYASICSLGAYAVLMTVTALRSNKWNLIKTVRDFVRYF